MLKVIKNNTDVDLITFKAEYSAFCSIGKKPFYGTIVIKYCPNQSLLELESLDSFIKSLSNLELTIEELVSLVFRTLKTKLETEDISILVKAKTTVHSDTEALIIRGKMK